MRSRKSGFSLIELTIAGAVMCFLVIGAASFLSGIGKNAAYLRAVSARDDVWKELSEALGDYDVFRISVAYAVDGSIDGHLIEATIERCVFGAKDDEDLCISGSMAPLALVSERSELQARRIDFLAGLGGLPKTDPLKWAPVRYDVNATKCADQNTASPTCPFEATAWLTAMCEGAAPKCPRAYRVRVDFNIALAEGITVAGGPPIAPRGAAVEFNPQGRGKRTCGMKEYATGVTDDGSVLCEHLDFGICVDEKTKAPCKADRI